MNEKFIPELHDIGKLLWLRNPGKQWRHNFEDDLYLFDESFIKNDLTFKGILEHTCNKDYVKYPKRKETIILCVADDFAASSARPSNSQQRKPKHYNVHKLWNPPKSEKTSLEEVLSENPKSVEWKTKIVNFLESNPSAKDYFKKFEKVLRRRAEDSNKNITSLYIHSILTGKFYRILKEIVNEDFTGEIFKNMKKSCNKRKDIENRYPLQITRMKLNYSQKLYRARDLNILIKLKNIINEIEQESIDYLFFRFFNELIFITPSDSIIINKIVKKIITKDFWVEILGTCEFRYRQLYKERVSLFLQKPYGFLENQHNIWPELPHIISGNICQVCQMAEATEIYYKDEFKEELCKSCYSIRKEPKLKKVGGDWENTGYDIAFLKINIELETLHEILNILFKKQFGISEKVSLPVISEFQEDYKRFLIQLKSLIRSKYDIEESLPFDELIAIKMDNPSDIINIIKIILEKMGEYFPSFIEERSPLKFVLTYSNIKFPFFEHFNELNKYEAEIKIVFFGKGEMNLTLKQLEYILRMRLPNRAQILMLTAIAKDSRKLAEIIVKSRDYRRDYGDLRSAIVDYNIQFEDLLTYLKIRGDEL